MGNSSSTRSFSVENDGLMPRVDSVDSSVGGRRETCALRMSDRERACLACHQDQAGTLLPSPGEQLKMALVPFQRIAATMDQEAELPKEQEQLVKCMLNNMGDSLQCRQEINEFVQFVDKLTRCYPQ